MKVTPTVFVALLCVHQLVLGQVLTMSACATNCTVQLTSRFTSCSGIQCFCDDHKLAQLGFDCFEENCTVREALVGRNITSLTCQFPNRDRGAVSSAVTFTSLAIALGFVITRAIVFGISKIWGWDDIATGLATIVMIGNAVCNPISRRFGYGKDIWRIPFSDTNEVLKVFFIGGVFYTIGVALIKIAFLCFYLKLFPSRAFRKVAYPLLGICFVYGIVFTFLFIFQCSPVSYTWMQWDGEADGKCLNFDLGAVIHAIINIFVTLVSILRLYSMVQLDGSMNQTWDFIPFGYFTDLEFNVGIACICMPSIRVVLRRYFPNCGLATTEGSSMIGPSNQQAPRLVKISGKNLSRSTNHRATADTSSDRVELYPYNRAQEVT
ncbi:hypothetical protein LTR84_001439 [Exophiala bonariae]|uniref:Extracellular membrane protein CFEM domain-containing protein n=1 Tax=Exophiala bonariae TaxID=1690606 RepID=A0AAV9NCL7_9EURO|nr:hypothetical protein LTR84_001439 [Exophiala bonariae]